MKKKLAIFLSIFALALAALACQFPGTGNPTPTETMPPTQVTTEVPTETPTETATEPPTATPTTEPTPSLSVFPNPVIFSFSFFTPSQGWAVTQDRNNILVTQDGGQTWLDATPSSLGPMPSGRTSFGLSPFFLDENTAWVTPGNMGSGTGTIYHTTDGGVNWSSNTVPFDNARYFFVDANGGYALVDLGAGAGSQYVAIYQTNDSGANWTQVFTHEPGASKSLPESGHKAGLTFLDMNHGWIGGDIPMTDHFYFYYTTDGGVTWAQETDISLPATYSGSFLGVQQPFFINGMVGYLPVRALTAGGDTYYLIYSTDDGGQTWSYQGDVQDGKAVDFYSLDSGWIAADSGLYFSSDSGVTWSPAAANGIPSGEYMLKVDFVDLQNGWALGTPDSSTQVPLNLYHTTDGGANWTKLLP
jgi:photosystem II stability/assembly factor-like uncharacterized protein